MAIASLNFKNFKVFRNADLPLGRTTLIIGPNGTGKTTCLKAIDILAAIQRNDMPTLKALQSFGIPNDQNVEIHVNWDSPQAHTSFRISNSAPPVAITGDSSRAKHLKNARVFSFEPAQVAAQISPIRKTLEIAPNGQGIPSVLTSLQDQYPERFEELNKDLTRWLPEFDRVLLDTPEPNARAFLLRTREGKHRVPAALLSQGTLIAVALLTLCHLPELPPIIGIEEPDRGMHPRLLKDVLDAVQRLSNPEEFGDMREPVQVVMTTHSPYFLDLFRDRLEDVLIVEKQGLYSSLRKLSEIPNVEQILMDSHLGESWFSGILGGVPVHT